ncbi:hypothetical protein CMUS01_13416 [Colletotrichum musicola]|uniref:Uncharacterized protein n=1 Tax=Colletotrichum musicola TaxID=2175873 RepID=A0A8H6JCN8_9PEZI|nr:hypothetical protein CMUS01_13416 [Colletotrichum musicola]
MRGCRGITGNSRSRSYSPIETIRTLPRHPQTPQERPDLWTRITLAATSRRQIRQHRATSTSGTLFVQRHGQSHAGSVPLTQPHHLLLQASVRIHVPELLLSPSSFSISAPSRSLKLLTLPPPSAPTPTLFLLVVLEVPYVHSVPFVSSVPFAFSTDCVGVENASTPETRRDGPVAGLPSFGCCVAALLHPERIEMPTGEFAGPGKHATHFFSDSFAVRLD